MKYEDTCGNYKHTSSTYEYIYLNPKDFFRPRELLDEEHGGIPLRGLVQLVLLVLICMIIVIEQISLSLSIHIYIYIYDNNDNHNNSNSQSDSCHCYDNSNSRAARPASARRVLETKDLRVCFEQQY